MKMFRIWYKDIKNNKLYRSRVRAFDETRAMECLRDTLKYPIEILAIEEIQVWILFTSLRFGRSTSKQRYWQINIFMIQYNHNNERRIKMTNNSNNTTKYTNFYYMDKQTGELLTLAEAIQLGATEYDVSYSNSDDFNINRFENFFEKTNCLYSVG